jgi:hypothetical protein
MANVAAPTGFKPLRRMDGAAWSVSNTPYRIPDNYGTTIGYGDLVAFTTNGVITQAAAGAQFRGVFIGVKYVDSTGAALIKPSWAANTRLITTGSYAEALVVDDPFVVFAAQFTGATVPAVTELGSTYDIAVGTVNSRTGISGAGIDSTTSAATLKQFRFLKFLDRVDNDTASANSWGEFIPLKHDFLTQSGI